MSNVKLKIERHKTNNNTISFFLDKKKYVKDSNHLHKILKEKLKDRYRIKGAFFSVPRNKQKIKYKTNKEGSSSLLNIEEANYLLSKNNYEKLKHDIYVKEKNDKEKKRKENVDKDLFKKDINYTSLKETIYQFLRFKNRSNLYRANIMKNKIELKLANKISKKNFINQTLKTVKLHFSQVKGKIDLGRKPMEETENEYAYKKLAEKIENSRLKYMNKLKNENEQISQNKDKSWYRKSFMFLNRSEKINKDINLIDILSNNLTEKNVSINLKNEKMEGKENSNNIDKNDYKIVKKNKRNYTTYCKTESNENNILSRNENLFGNINKLSNNSKRKKTKRNKHILSDKKLKIDINNINFNNIEIDNISPKLNSLKCDSNGRCSSCRTNYYYDKEAYNKNKDNNKICLTYKECLDIGIPLIDFNLCYNCKEHNGYKLPNTNDCVSSVDNLNTYYYYKYAEYNALGRCHKKCNGCFGAPKGEKEQNCRDCLDTVNYVYNETTHNCDKIEIEIKEDKCPNLLYYIDNSETDIDKKKKCIPEGNLCPDDYPYLIQYLNLCVEKCPENNFIEWNEDFPIITYNTHENKDLIFKNILDNSCVHFSNDKDYILDFWEYFDEKITNERYSIFYYFYPYYGRNLETYNDGQSLYIFGEDTTLHITRLSVENSYIFKNQKNNNFEYNSNSNYFDKYYFFINNGEYYSYRNTRRVSIIYLSECEKLIKRLNNILDSTDLLLLKLDIYRNDTKNEIMTNKVEYKIYHPTGDFEFDLEICDNYPINIITPTYIYEGLEENKKLLKVLRNVVKKGYEPFILYSNFYTETCEQYSNEDNVDMTLKDRRKYIYEKIKNFKFCEKNCYYKSTDENINFINCICKAKITQNLELDDLSFNTLDEENEKNYYNTMMSAEVEKYN